MRAIAELLPVLPEVRVVGPAGCSIGGIDYWIGHAAPGMMFVAIPIAEPDGHELIGAAIEAGASAILCERLPEQVAEGVTYVVVPDTVKAMGVLVHALHGFPSRRMRVVGVTGTNGKTTTATLLHRLFRTMGKRAGLLSNIGDWMDNARHEPRYTTGPATHIAPMMARMVEAECGHCFMEISSASVVEQRTKGVAFAGGIFTNLTRDHLNYHGSMAAYAAAKKAWLSALPADALALANGDDPRGRWMLDETAARRLTYGTEGGNDYRLKILGETLDGLTLDVNGRRLRSKLLGAFNAYNVAACYAAACELGEEPAEIVDAIATLEPVEGRMQAIRAGDGRIAVIDFAHSPDAVEKVLRHLGASRAPGARILTVIGCGGGGDTKRRPAMGAAAAALSDRLILTSDNARDEDPAKIAADMLEGIDADGRLRTNTILDRREAIETACEEARPGDVVLIAGKGNERHQEIGGIRIPFDDLEVARIALGLA